MELEKLSRSATDKTDILFIDGLVKRECNGDRLSSLWERDGGTGLYPPPSIQSLLRTYLLDGIPMHVKHCIVIYVFLDLAGLLDSRRCVCILKFLCRLLPSSGNNLNSIHTLNTSYYRHKYFYVYFVCPLICCVWHSIHEMLFLPNNGMLKSEK